MQLFLLRLDKSKAVLDDKLLCCNEEAVKCPSLDFKNLYRPCLDNRFLLDL